MIVLIFAACFANNSCTEQRLPLDLNPKFPLAQCTVVALPTLAKWMGEHPQYDHLGEFHCAPGSEASL